MSFKNIIITVLCLWATSSFAQNIRGTIKSQTGEAIPFANIAVLNSAKGAVSDQEGNFSLDLPPGNYQITASVVGYISITKKVKIDDRTTEINFVLSEESKDLDEITIRGNSDSYTGDETQLLTRLPMKIMEAPQTVQTITRKILNDQQANTLNDVYKNSSGVISTGATAYTGALIRGFNSGPENILYNGQRGAIGGGTFVPFLPHIQEVQILKGASGVLFGEGSLGGTINLITKKPLDKPYYELFVAGGSFDTYRIQYDATGPIDKGKKLAYRLSGGYENAESFSDHFYNKTFIIAPALSYQPNKSTKIEYNGFFMRDNRNVGWQNGVPAVNNNIFALDRSFSANDPDDFAKTGVIQSQLGINQKIVKGLSLSAYYNFARTKWNGEYWISSVSSAISEGTGVDNEGVLERFWEENIQNVTYDYHSANVFLNYSFTGKNLKHGFTLGFDYNYRNDLFPEAQDVEEPGEFNVFQPNYTLYDKDTLEGDRYLYEIKSKSNSLYLQYVFNWKNKLTILLGARFQDYAYDTEFTVFNDRENAFIDASETNEFIPRVGLNYLISPQHAVFAGYSTGFIPQDSNNPSQGGPFPARRGNQYEIGYKGSWFKNRLNSSLSLYQIKQSNLLTPDLSDPDGLRLTPAGEVTSKGIEIDLMGSISENWNLILNYAYNDLQVTKSNIPEEEGQRFANWIPHTANFWTLYSFEKVGLRLGVGINYADQRYILSDISAPSYFILNTLIGYRYKGFDISLNINNITAEDYVSGAVFGSPNYIFRGAPANFLVGLRYKLE